MAQPTQDELLSVHNWMRNNEDQAPNYGVSNSIDPALPENYVEMNPRYTTVPGTEVPVMEPTSLGIPGDDYNYGAASPMPVGEVQTDFNPRDVNKEAVEKRQAIVAYLQDKYASAADNRGVQQARQAARQMNTISNIGHGLTTMLTARSQANGGQGADDRYWEGLKRDAAGRVDEAGADRQAAIQDFVAKNNMGRQAIQDLGQQESGDYATAMRTPGTPQSLAAVNYFNKLFKDANVDPATTSAADIEKMIKSTMAKAQQDSNIGYKKTQQELMDRETSVKEGLLGVAQTKANKGESKKDEAMAKYYNAKASAEGGDKGAIDMSVVPGYEYNGEIVLRDKKGNFYDAGKQPIDGSKIKLSNPEDKKPPTGEQLKTAGFWDRAERANMDFDDLEAKGYPAPQNYGHQQLISTYLSTSSESMKAVSKSMMSEQDINYANASQSFINAILRKDSGAAIPDSEYAKYKYMLPEQGDSPQVLANKKSERQNMISSLEVEAGDKLTGKIRDKRKGLPNQGMKETIAPQQKPLNSEDEQALEWSNKNPNDPRSAEIKRRLGR